MAGGFFYSIGYISTKIVNLGKIKFTNPTTAFSKSLLEGSNHAKKEFDHSKKNSTKRKATTLVSKNIKPVQKNKKVTKKKTLTKKKTVTKIKFPKKDDYFEDLTIDFVIKCNTLVCALISKISKNNLNYDFELIKPEFYLIDLCSDFTQYKSLVKSVKVNFDILNEVPEENFVSMKDVYYYVYNHLI